MKETPKLLSIPKAALVLGEDEETVRRWVRRKVDPLPSVPSGATGTRRKVVMAEVDGWLLRQAQKEGCAL